MAKRTYTLGGKRLTYERLEDRRVLSVVPSHVQSLISQGEIDTDDLELLSQGFLNAQLYDGWDGNAVDATPLDQEAEHSQVWEDSTKGLQKAIDDAYENGYVAYIPAGNYKTSDTLAAFQWGKLNGPPDNNSNVVVGDPDGGTTLTLADNATKFDSLDSEGNPRPMLLYRHLVHPSQSSFTKIPVSHPEAATYYPNGDWVNTPNEHANDGGTELFGSRSNILFHDEVRDLNFDLNGHAAGFGLYMPGAQASSVANVSIDATGAYAGIWGLPGRNGGAVNVTVVGGQYGIIYKPGGLGNASPNTEAMFQSEIVNAHLYDQTVSAITSTDQSTLVVVGFHITRSAPGSAVRMANADNSTASGSIDFVDGVIELTSGTAINNVGGNNAYFRNVYVSGSSALVQSGSQPVVSGSGAWSLIEEYAYTDQNTANNDPPYETGDTKFRSFSVIDGVVSTTPEPATRIATDVAAPSPAVYEQHSAGVLPSYLSGSASKKNATDFGATVDDSSDDRAAIQAAIDAASLEGHGEVYLPPGEYRIGGTLYLHANTKLFGAGRQLTHVRWHDSWQPVVGEATMFEANGGLNATTFLGFLSIEMRTKGNVGNPGGDSTDQTADDFDRFNAIHWMAGRNSMMFAIELTQQWKGGGASKEQETQPHSQIKFSGAGGGRHYFVDTDQSDQADKHPDLRKVLIDGTTEPLWIYGFNLEHAETNAEAEIRNAKNVRIYGVKSEEGGVFNDFTAGWGESPTILIVDSQNIAVYGGSGIRKHISEFATNPGAFVVLGDSDDILIGNVIAHTVQSAPNGGPLFYENLNGHSPVEIAWPDALNVYKRGEIDDSVMVRDPNADLSLFEFELVSPVDASPSSWTTIFSANASGGAYVQIDGVGPGDYIEYEFDIPAGDYFLAWESADSPYAGVAQLYIDGEAVAAPSDLYSPDDATDSKELGPVHFDADGPKTFRFELLGRSLASSGYTLGLDALRLTQADTTSTEAEDFSVAGASGDSWNVFTHENSSGGEYLWFGANAVDDYLDLTIDAPTAGAYQIGTRVGASTGLGVFELLIQGQPVGEPQDLYASSFVFEDRDLGVASFDSPGEQTVRFRVVGKNPASSGYKLVIDSLSLTPVALQPSTQEIEQHPVTGHSHAGYTPITTTSASGQGFVEYQAIADGDAISFGYGEASAGTYSVEVGYRSAPNAGVFQVTIDGQPIGAPLDAYSNTYDFAQRLVGLVDLTGGAVEATFEIVGMNGQSSGRGMGLDWLRLVPVVVLPGDYDLNGVVEQADHATWAASYGAQGVGLSADGNGDGVVNAADYTVWRDHLVYSLTAIAEVAAVAAATQTITAPAEDTPEQQGTVEVSATIPTVDSQPQAQLKHVDAQKSREALAAYPWFVRTTPAYRASYGGPSSEARRHESRDDALALLTHWRTEEVNEVGRANTAADISPVQPTRLAEPPFNDDDASDDLFVVPLYDAVFSEFLTDRLFEPVTPELN